MSEKLLLVDGHSLFHRAYHALPPLTASSGQPTNALYGFLQMMLALLEDESPDFAVVAVDLPGPTFRDDIYKEYKAHRPPTEDALVSQFPLLADVIAALGVTQVGVPGYEADDVIGTMARVGADAGLEVLVVTGDKDMLQLVRPGVEVVATIKGLKQTKRYDEEAVREETGLTPAQIVDLKALAGDSSDNIPGVKGIGEKSAVAILEQAETVEKAIAAGEEIEPARLAKLLKEDSEMALLSKRLATIDTDVATETDLADCRWGGLPIDELRKLAATLDFTSLLSRLPGGEKVPSDLRMEPTEDVAALEELAANARDAGAMDLALTQGVEGELTLAVAAGDHPVGLVALSGADEDAGTLFDDGAEAATDLAPLADVLEDPTVDKRGTELKDIARALSAVGITIDGLEFAPEVASYLLMPNRRDHSIDLVVQEHLGEALPDGETATLGDLTPAQTRAGAMAKAVGSLHQPMREHLRAADLERLFDEAEMPLVRVLADMEDAGIALDVERLEAIGGELDEMLAGLQTEIHEVAGREFNIGSPKQLGEVLFEDLELPHGRKTKTGWSTSASVLDDIADEHEIVAKVLEWRKYAKLKSTYVDGLSREVDAETGRVHTTFEQTVVATGRLSSRNPNLQNIPIRTEWGRKIRGCFVAGGEERILIAADYSQIELRVLAHMSGDPRLVEAFRAGEDIHARTAAAIFDVPLEDVTAQMRGRAKTVNFAVLYGQGPVALARQLDVTREEAAEFIANYFERLDGVRNYMDGIVAAAREQMFVTTLLGRKRPIPDINSKNQRAASYAERTAVNTPIQGTAADIIKLAMIRLAEELAGDHPETVMLLQVHDELVLEAPVAAAHEVGRLVKEVMESSFELDVPLTVDVKTGNNWSDMQELDVA